MESATIIFGKVGDRKGPKETFFKRGKEESFLCKVKKHMAFVDEKYPELGEWDVGTAEEETEFGKVITNIYLKGEYRMETIKYFLRDSEKAN